jgi:transcriptional regulator GlxA family with amidase domain
MRFRPAMFTEHDRSSRDPISPNAVQHAGPCKRATTEPPVHRFDASCDDQDQLNDLLRQTYGQQYQFTGQGRRGRLQLRRDGFEGITLSQWMITAPIKARLVAPPDPPLSISSLKAGNVGGHFGARYLGGIVGRARPLPRRPDIVEAEDKLADVSVHIAMSAVRTALARRLSFVPQEPIRFEPSFFAPDLHERWNEVEATLMAFRGMERCPPLALTNLRDYAIGLLLDQHQNNYSRFLRHRETISRGTVRDAMQWMRERGGDPITVGDTAEAMGCSLGALTRGFQDHQGIAPSSYLYSLRLDLARQLLRRDPTAQTVVEVALETGFIDKVRFDRLYALRHGESAADTLRRNAPGRVNCAAAGLRLSPSRIEQLREHIANSLSEPIRLADLARVAGLAIHNLVVAFRQAFGTTPAQYVLGERLRRARWLLEHTARSIAVIAAETGFSSQSHLCTQFKLKEKLTPMQYRRNALSA